MAARRSTKENGQRKVQSIEVGFRVIRVMEAAEGTLPLRDIAAAANMSPSKAHLYLASFVQEEVAYQDPVTGQYGLGPFAIQLGLSTIRQLDVVQMSRRTLTQLSASTGFAAYLSLWGNRGPSIVSKVDGRYQGSLAVRLGYVLPLLASATGKVFFAHLEEHQVAPIFDAEIATTASQPGEERTAEAMRLSALAERDLVREKGYAISSNKVNWDFSGIAAPVMDYSNSIVAALTILGSQSALKRPQQDQMIGAVMREARHLSAQLGAGAAAD